ncbi:hypothetical protein ACHAQA_002223 [Verticillium albo-atrum]
MAQNIEFKEKAIRDAMLSDLGLSRNDELPMENFHDRKVTYDPGRRPSRAVTNTATAAWKVVGKQGIDDEEARSVQGLADLGGGRSHAAKHDTENQNRKERIQQISNRPRPQHGALANISNFGGVTRPGVPVKVFTSKSSGTVSTPATNIPPHKRPKTVIQPEEIHKDQPSQDAQSVPSIKTATFVPPHLRSKVQDVLQPTQAALQSVAMLQAQQQSQLLPLQQSYSVPASSEPGVGRVLNFVQNTPLTPINEQYSKVLWTWFTDCEVKIDDGNGAKRFEARVVLKMIELSDGQQQAGFLLHYQRPTGDKGSENKKLLVETDMEDDKENMHVHLVYDMTSYKPHSGRHEANWCDVFFESAAKNKEMTLFFEDAEVMNSFRSSAVALQASLSVSRLTPAQQSELHKRLEAKKNAASGKSQMTATPSTELHLGHANEAELINVDNDAMQLVTVSTDKIETEQETSNGGSQEAHSSGDGKSKVTDGKINDKTGSEQSIDPTVTKYTPDALKSLGSASPHVAPSVIEWQYTDSILKNGRRIKTPKSVVAKRIAKHTAKRAALSRIPGLSKKVLEAQGKNTTKALKEPEIDVDFSIPSSVTSAKSSIRGSRVKVKVRLPEPPKPVFNFTSPPGAPTMPRDMSLDSQAENQSNLVTTPKARTIFDRQGAQAQSEFEFTFESPPHAPTMPGAETPQVQSEPECTGLAITEPPTSPAVDSNTDMPDVPAPPEENSSLCNTANTFDRNSSDGELGKMWSMLSMMKSINKIDVIEETTTVTTTRRYVLPVGTSFPNPIHGQAIMPQPVATGVVSDVDGRFNSATRLSADAPVFQPTASSSGLPATTQNVFQVGDQSQQKRKGLADSKYAQSTQLFGHAGQFTGL